MLHYTYSYTTLHYSALQYTTLDYTTTHNTAAHYTTFHYTRYTTPQLQLQLHYTNRITITTTAPLHYSYNYSCATPHYIQQLWMRWPLQPLQPLEKKLQPPFGPPVDSLCHPCITTTHLSYSVLSLKLPPPPCAALPVNTSQYHHKWKVQTLQKWRFMIWFFLWFYRIYHYSTMIFRSFHEPVDLTFPHRLKAFGRPMRLSWSVWRTLLSTNKHWVLANENAG